jgi:hypothetical protein
VAVIVTERFLIRAVFRELIGSDEHGVVVGQGPEADVEQPMGILAEGKSVAGVVVAGVGKLVDVCRIDNAPGGGRNQPVAGQGTGVP